MVSRAVLAVFRHADYLQQSSAPSAHQPWPLSDEGNRQTTRGAERLKAILEPLELGFSTTLHSSPLLRAWQTASGLAKALELDEWRITTHEHLMERSVGSVANLSLEQIEEAIALDPRFDAPPDDWKRQPDYRLPFPGAESLAEAGTRVASMLEALADTSTSEREANIVVGHGAAIRHAGVNLGLFDQAGASARSMHHAMPILLERREGRWSQIGGEWKWRDNGLD